MEEEVVRHQGGPKPKVRCLRLVRFADVELRDATGLALDNPTSIDFFDCLSYYKKEPTPFTGRAQGVDPEGNVTAEGFFVEGRPEGRWTRWHDNGLKREEFLITSGECCYARHWDENGSPI